jgi:hypothetical protein
LDKKSLDKNPDNFYTNNKNGMKKWTSVRAVYLLMSLVLLSGILFSNWYIVIFVIAMLNVGVWTKFCPSKWFFEKIGFKKSDL